MDYKICNEIKDKTVFPMQHFSKRLSNRLDHPTKCFPKVSPKYEINRKQLNKTVIIEKRKC